MHLDRRLDRSIGLRDSHVKSRSNDFDITPGRTDDDPSTFTMGHLEIRLTLYELKDRLARTPGAKFQLSRLRKSNRNALR
jgi:hypothetical protein